MRNELGAIMIQLLEKFRALSDYRKCKQLKFNMGEIMFMSLLAILAGANGYQDMELWIKAKKRELKQLLGYSFIAPADNTALALVSRYRTQPIDEAICDQG